MLIYEWRLNGWKIESSWELSAIILEGGKFDGARLVLRQAAELLKAITLGRGMEQGQCSEYALLGLNLAVFRRTSRCWYF